MHECYCPTQDSVETYNMWVIEIVADQNQNDMNMLPIVVSTAPNAHLFWDSMYDDVCCLNSGFIGELY